MRWPCGRTYEGLSRLSKLREEKGFYLWPAPFHGLGFPTELKRRKPAQHNIYCFLLSDCRQNMICTQGHEFPTMMDCTLKLWVKIVPSSFEFASCCVTARRQELIHLPKTILFGYTIGAWQLVELYFLPSYIPKIHNFFFPGISITSHRQ